MLLDETSVNTKHYFKKYLSDDSKAVTMQISVGKVKDLYLINVRHPPDLFLIPSST